MRRICQLLDAYTHTQTHLVIITRLHQFQLHWLIRQFALARRQRNEQTVFESLPPATIVTYVNHIKAKSSHCPFNAEGQAGKLWILIFKVFWYGSTRKWTPVYRLQGGRSYHYSITAQSSVAEPANRNAQISINKKWPSWAASTCFITVKILLVKLTVTVTLTVTSYFFKTVAVR